MSNYIYPISATSANTEVLICSVCSGNTFTVEPPHAVWTDGQNKPIIQMNTVVLGGVNGLNN
jgi:hypothetical protein